VPISESPKVHYRYSDGRPEYTPCGKWSVDVITTPDRDRVSCSDCEHEISAGGLFLPSDLTRCAGAVPGLGRSAICGQPTPHLAHDFSPS
jgi:hypothetical protein